VCGRLAGEDAPESGVKGVVRAMSVGWVVSRVFSSGTLACSHCGSTELHPYPGLLGELGGVLGRVRYACRACRRNTWLSRDADPPPTPAESELEAPCLLHARTALDALDVDIEVAPLRAPRADLRALDEELARDRRGRKKH